MSSASMTSGARRLTASWARSSSDAAHRADCPCRCDGGRGGAGSCCASSDAGRGVRARLQALADMVNRTTVDGLGPEARASSSARSSPKTSTSSWVRARRRSAAVTRSSAWPSVCSRGRRRSAEVRGRVRRDGADGKTADVHLTAEFIRRSITTGEDSLDAREFMIGMRRVGADWQIAKVTAVETLK